MFYSCPVCGYSQMTEAPNDYAICPSCGIQFGYDDVSKKYRRLRNEWLANGAIWFSPSTPPPGPFWNGFRQVIEAGLQYDVDPPKRDVDMQVVQYVVVAAPYWVTPRA